MALTGIVNMPNHFLERFALTILTQCCKLLDGLERSRSDEKLGFFLYSQLQFPPFSREKECIGRMLCARLWARFAQIVKTAVKKPKKKFVTFTSAVKIRPLM